MKNIPEIELIRHPETGELVHEIWLNVANYNGNYIISNYGRIVSLKRLEEWSFNGKIFSRTRNQKLLKTYIDRYGYECCHLTINGKTKQHTIHKIVSLAFHNNTYKPLLQVNHIDGNKLNNHYLNLEWCTAQENVIHSHEMGLTKKQTGKNHHASKKVIAIQDTSIIEFDCLSDCARYLKSSVTNISQAIKLNNFAFGHKIYLL